MSRSPAPEHILNLQTRIILGKEKKEPTDDTRKDVYLLLAQHVSGINMPIIRRQTE